MKERPILFQGAMVRAILSGTKTQTRRAVKGTSGRPLEFLGGGPVGGPDWNDPSCWGYEHQDSGSYVLLRPTDSSEMQYPCPYGQPGDRMWGRETWMPDAPRNGEWNDTSFYGCGMSPLSDIPECYRKPWHCLHRATYEGCELIGWKPSIHMPRWASRITLEITGVRVEQLQDISEADARAEGITPTADPTIFGVEGRHLGLNARESYCGLWDSINGPGSVEANPWVWVVEFRRLGAQDASRAAMSAAVAL